MELSKDIRSRAIGCLAGQLIGDALGSQVEFKSKDNIRHMYPEGLREIQDGGTFNTVAGQPTDDSEMALALARILINKGFDAHWIRCVYKEWICSGPFDCGGTISSGLSGHHNLHSEANGALMRISPLAIYGAGKSSFPNVTRAMAVLDSIITHINPVCLEANECFVTGAHLLILGYPPAVIWKESHASATEDAIVDAMTLAHDTAPDNYERNMGHVIIALQNAFYQLLHAESFEAALVDTVMQGGDTDTNCAICGALYGAYCGVEGIPPRWLEVIYTCDTTRGTHPRPLTYSPRDFAEVATGLLERGWSERPGSDKMELR